MTSTTSTAISFDAEVERYLPILVDRVVQEVDPERILLFGSRARGDSRPDSDVDIFVIFRHLDRSEKRPMMIRILGLLQDRRVPVDVLVTDLDEIQRRGTIIGTTLREALRDGKVLFERR